jgi:hypothetical protein
MHIDAWHSFEVIISSASGCGVMVKDSGSLFDKDDVYYQKHCFCGVSSTLYPNLVKMFLTL